MVCSFSMSDRIETALQAGAPPIKGGDFDFVPISLAADGGIPLLGALERLEEILEADQKYHSSKTSGVYNPESAALAAHAQTLRTTAKFMTPDNWHFSLEIPEGATLITPGEQKSPWGGYENIERYQVVGAETYITGQIVYAKRMHAGRVPVPGHTPYVRLDIDGLRVRHGVVQVGLGAAALDKIELVQSPSKNDIENAARHIGTFLGFTFAL